MQTPCATLTRLTIEHGGALQEVPVDKLQLASGYYDTRPGEYEFEFSVVAPASKVVCEGPVSRVAFWTSSGVACVFYNTPTVRIPGIDGLRSIRVTFLNSASCSRRFVVRVEPRERAVALSPLYQRMLSAFGETMVWRCRDGATIPVCRELVALSSGIFRAHDGMFGGDPDVMDLTDYDVEAASIVRDIMYHCKVYVAQLSDPNVLLLLKRLCYNDLAEAVRLAPEATTVANCAEMLGAVVACEGECGAITRVVQAHAKELTVYDPEALAAAFRPKKE